MRPPYVVNLVWFAAAVALVVTGLVLGDRRDRMVVIGVLLVALVVSYVTYSRVFFGINAGLQGRHVLPIFALVPIWSGVVVAERLRPRLFAVGVRVAAVALPLVVLIGLYLNAKRYAVGLGPDSGPALVRPRCRVVATAGVVPLAGSRGRRNGGPRGRVGPDHGGSRGPVRDDPVTSPMSPAGPRCEPRRRVHDRLHHRC